MLSLFLAVILSRPVQVSRVIDGDTVVIGAEHIRLMGIDAPEIAHNGHPAQCYGVEATEELRILLGQGSIVAKPVRVERHGKDKYGRTLAYLYQGDLNLSEIMLARGFARIYASRHPKRFEAVEAEARAAKVGLWEGCEPR